VACTRTLFVGAYSTAISGRSMGWMGDLLSSLVCLAEFPAAESRWVVLLDGAIRRVAKSPILACRQSTENCVDEENNVEGKD
jgi:penicillin V acylase-like amidase (Ntn superfamily)